MPIREESFRIGSGRYIQGNGYVSRIGDEVLRLGNAPLVVGGKTALERTEARIRESLDEKCGKYEIVVHRDTCNHPRAQELAVYMNENGFDVVVGVGGGVICDFAKLIGYYAKKPVINVATQSATCASYTPLSVCYSPEGKTVGTQHYSYEVNGVIADTGVIITQPVRLLLSGVFDALAKFVEIKQRFNEETTEYPLGLDYAYVLSKYSFKLLCDKTQKCIYDMEAGEVTDDFEKLVYTLIAATGVISGIARGSNQTALGHKFYDTTRFLFPKETKPYLHGEIVGVGLLMQNYFNGEIQNNELLLELMKKYNMPSSVTDIGVSKDSFEAYYEKLKTTSAINGEDENECRRMREALQYLFSL